MIHWYWLILICPFCAGVGYVATAILATAKDADDYEPVEHPPEPRVSTQIFDGLSKRRTTI